jgi:hypothetical protein
VTSSISPRLAREDYDAFKILLRSDHEFPDTWEEWQSHTLRDDVKRVNSGHGIQAVAIGPKEFEDYCRACGREPSSSMLLAFAVVKAGRKP